MKIKSLSVILLSISILIMTLQYFAMQKLSQENQELSAIVQQ